MTIVIDSSIGDFGQIKSYINGIHQEGRDHDMLLDMALNATQERDFFIGTKNEWGGNWAGSLDDVKI